MFSRNGGRNKNKTGAKTMTRAEKKFRKKWGFRYEKKMVAYGNGVSDAIMRMGMKETEFLEGNAIYQFS